MMLSKVHEMKKWNAKFSDPQQLIIERLRQGYRLRTINAHRMNGGTIVWVNPNGNEEHAGHIYRALQHLLWKLNVEKHEGLFI